MMHTAQKFGAKLLAATAGILLMAATAQAQNNFTPAGTAVENTFTLDYAVSGTAQPQITNDGAGGNPAPTTFTVDRIVDVVVAYQANGDDATVAPGAQDEELIFLVRNDGNDNLAFDLSTTQPGTDDFDTTGILLFYYVDDGDGVFEPGGDDGAAVAYTLGDPTPDIAPDAILWVEVVADVPVAQPDTDIAEIVLTADSLFPTAWLEEAAPVSPGTAIGPDDGTNSAVGAADNVLADAAGDTDLPNAGDHSDTGQFTVASPNLTASKAVSVISTNLDGLFNCATGTQVSANEYAVPGACVQYVITVTNAGSAAASITTLSDTLPAELTYVGSTFTNFTGGTPATPTAGTDCGTAACVVSQTGGTVAATTTATIVIRASVN